MPAALQRQPRLHLAATLPPPAPPLLRGPAIRRRPSAPPPTAPRLLAACPRAPQTIPSATRALPHSPDRARPRPPRRLARAVSPARRTPARPARAGLSRGVPETPPDDRHRPSARAPSSGGSACLTPRPCPPTSPRRTTPPDPRRVPAAPPRVSGALGDPARRLGQARTDRPPVRARPIRRPWRFRPSRLHPRSRTGPATFPHAPARGDALPADPPSPPQGIAPSTPHPQRRGLAAVRDGESAQTFPPPRDEARLAPGGPSRTSRHPSAARGARGSTPRAEDPTPQTMRRTKRVRAHTAARHDGGSALLISAGSVGAAVHTRDCMRKQ
jgi:hypothetical protein